jgi:tripartite-type tricarboxylate transporter receptor subunit TctC
MMVITLCASEAQAQAWPARPVRMIVAFPPGGPADVAARVVSQKVAERLGQTVIVENRPGATGNIGGEAAVRAAPDGYTFLYAITGLVMNPFVYKLNWDPLTDLVPVGRVGSVSFVLIVNPNFAPRTVPELLAFAKAKPKEVTCAHTGSLPQMGCELLRTLGGVDITTVPYKGLAAAMADVVGGQVNLMFEAQFTATPAVRNGRVRAVANVSPRRAAGPFADLPAIADTLPGFEIEGFHGIVAPARTPREIVLRMNQEIRASLTDPETHKRLADAGLEPAPSTPEQFGDTLKQDYAKYGRIIREAGIKAE